MCYRDGLFILYSWLGGSMTILVALVVVGKNVCGIILGCGASVHFCWFHFSFVVTLEASFEGRRIGLH
jgi:hypothetical protein